MAFHKIDMENWPRREFYQHYIERLQQKINLFRLKYDGLYKNEVNTDRKI